MSLDLQSGTTLGVAGVVGMVLTKVCDIAIARWQSRRDAMRADGDLSVKRMELVLQGSDQSVRQLLSVISALKDRCEDQQKELLSVKLELDRSEHRRVAAETALGVLRLDVAAMKTALAAHGIAVPPIEIEAV